MVCINLLHYRGKLATMQHICIYYEEVIQYTKVLFLHENIKKDSLYHIGRV